MPTSVTTFPVDATPTLRLRAFAVTTARMPRIELADLLFRSGRVRPFTEPLVEREPRPLRKGIPKYVPPPFPRLYAALRFNFPRAFAVLRVAFLVVSLSRA